MVILAGLLLSFYTERNIEFVKACTEIARQASGFKTPSKRHFLVK